MCLYEREKCATYVSIIGGATQVSGISWREDVSEDVSEDASEDVSEDMSEDVQ